MSQDVAESNIARALRFLRRRGLWIVACAILAAAAAFAYSKHETRKYTATAAVVFSNSQLSQAIAGLPSANAGNSLLQQSDNLELLHLGDLAEKTAAIVGQGLTGKKVSESVTISGAPESSIANLSAVSTSPEVAASIANVYAAGFVKEQEEATGGFYRTALALVRKQLAELSPRQRFGTAGLELQSRAQTLTLLAGLQPRSVELAEHAVVPTQPSSPRTSRNLLIGVLLGLVLGLCVALLIERVDQRMAVVGELELAYNAAVLGVLPQSASLSHIRSKGSALALLPSDDAEAFHMIFARLKATHPDRRLQTVVVTSATQREGKTTVALHLAEAAARMGSRVILIELNMRNPMLAEVLDIRPDAGLTEILRGTAGLYEATSSVISQSAADPRRRLDVIVAGQELPENPVELIESGTMNALLAEVKSGYDVIVIDAPELLGVSDALLLAAKADGLVLVGRIGSLRRDDAAHMRRILEQCGAPVLGVVANGVRRRRRVRKPSGRRAVPAGKEPFMGGVSEEERLAPTLEA